MVHIVFDNLSLAGVVDVFTNKLMDGLITTDGIFKTCGVDAMIVAWRLGDQNEAKQSPAASRKLSLNRKGSAVLPAIAVRAVEHPKRGGRTKIMPWCR